jgi:hypothetical protein
MTDFAAWRYENLVQFAKESTERMNLLNAEIEALNADLKAAINAYRDLLRRDASVLLEATHSTETKQTGE